MENLASTPLLRAARAVLWLEVLFFSGSTQRLQVRTLAARALHGASQNAGRHPQRVAWGQMECRGAHETQRDMCTPSAVRPAARTATAPRDPAWGHAASNAAMPGLLFYAHYRGFDPTVVHMVRLHFQCNPSACGPQNKSLISSLYKRGGLQLLQTGTFPPLLHLCRHIKACPWYECSSVAD